MSLRGEGPEKDPSASGAPEQDTSNENGLLDEADHDSTENEMSVITMATAGITQEAHAVIKGYGTRRGHAVGVSSSAVSSVDTCGQKPSLSTPRICQGLATRQKSSAVGAAARTAVTQEGLQSRKPALKAIESIIAAENRGKSVAVDDSEPSSKTRYATAAVTIAEGEVLGASTELPEPGASDAPEYDTGGI
ncbi:MAG: hypothetical protein M1812_006042 [Candelaria pacifica]|nr:MAG: hypothetical protein M1812_006042 [Candelaria pacifica]